MKYEIKTGRQIYVMLKKKKILQKDIMAYFDLDQTTVSRYFTDEVQMPAHFLIKVMNLARLTVADVTVKEYEASTASPSDAEVREPLERYILAESSAKVEELKRDVKKVNKRLYKKYLEMSAALSDLGSDIKYLEDL